MSRFTILRLTGVAVMAVVAAACGGQAAGSPATHDSARPSATAQTVAVELSDELRIEPAIVSVTAAQPVTFVVTNTGQTRHEFYLGDEAAQAEHEQEMAGSGGMMHDHANGIGLEPGETKELSFTFETGSWIAGCHIPGHYPAGMRATISAD